MDRNTYFGIFLRGLAMGAADVVPGVSGGTIAFITGIYERLLGAISSINFSLISVLKEKGIIGVWKQVDGNFLAALLSGILVSILSLANLITLLIIYYPIQLWSFFFGLIIASIWYVGKEIKNWHIGVPLGIIVGAALVVLLTIMPPMSPDTSLLYLFFCGAIAACAMILPGISGSFILLILGAYSTVIAAVADRNILIIMSVGIGAVLGLISFSKFLNFLLRKYHNTLIGVLTGFLVGSLWKIWPWKADPIIYEKDFGERGIESISQTHQSLSALTPNGGREFFDQYKAYIEHNVSPWRYEEINMMTDAQIPGALIFCVIGFALIFVVEFVAKKKNV
ncbi:MAG: DUF368 domain-containing protein [Weeksellaceae bacterium]|nr:DUF368 domain-containing protein [Weeksellaceae bacterium]